MALKKLLTYRDRPFDIVGQFTQKPRNPKWRPVHKTQVRYLDGRQPAVETLTAGELKKAKLVPATMALFWRRTDQLIQLGMDVERARAQATAEIVQGVTTPAAF